MNEFLMKGFMRLVEQLIGLRKYQTTIKETKSFNLMITFIVYNEKEE